MSERSNQVLLHTVLKSAKNDSSFIYFTLESNEGIAFYSTLEHVLGDQHRLIECYTPIELRAEFENIVQSLKEKISLEILSQQEIIDSL